MNILANLYYCFFESPLFSAIAENNTALISKLIKKKHHLNAKEQWGASVLTAAARANNLELVRTLIKLGLEVNHISNNSGSSPLNSAVMSGHFEVVKILVSEGANVNLATSDSDGAYTNMSPLMWAANRGFIEIASLLLESGANVNAVNGDNTTAKMYVVRNTNYNLDMFKLLLKYNPDVTIKDWRGRTIIDEIENWSTNSNRHEMKEIFEKRDKG
jgi:ankyrin repeat protein